MAETMREWYERKYKETKDENYRKMAQSQAPKEEPKDLSKFLTQ